MKTVQQLIDAALVRPEREGSGKYKPSNFGRCYRMQFWARSSEPQSNPPDERTLRVFKCGNHFEDWVKSLILQDGSNWIDGNTPDRVIECDDVKGFADLIRDNEVADVKSQNSRSFWWKAKEIKGGRDIREICYHNWMQVMYYVRELHKEFGRLIFISKDDLCIDEYVQKWDDYWREQLETELQILRDFWSKGILPPAEPRAFKSAKTGEYAECSYCNFRTLCEETEKRM